MARANDISRGDENSFNNNYVNFVGVLLKDFYYKVTDLVHWMTFKISNISGAKELSQTQNIPNYFTAKV